MSNDICFNFQMLRYWLITIQEAINIKWKDALRSCLNSKNPSSKNLPTQNLGIFFCNLSIFTKKMLNIRSKLICKGNKWSKWNKTHKMISIHIVSKDYRILVYYTLKKRLYKFCLYEIYDSIWTWNMVHKFIGELFWRYKNLLRFI
jgi:hypothetical protein